MTTPKQDPGVPTQSGTILNYYPTGPHGHIPELKPKRSKQDPVDRLMNGAVADYGRAAIRVEQDMANVAELGKAVEALERELNRLLVEAADGARASEAAWWFRNYKNPDWEKAGMFKRRYKRMKAKLRSKL